MECWWRRGRGWSLYCLFDQKLVPADVPIALVVYANSLILEVLFWAQLFNIYDILSLKDVTFSEKHCSRVLCYGAESRY